MSSGASAGERLVGPDLVEELSVTLDLEAEVVAVVDLVPVEMLVLQSRRGAGGLEAGAVVGDERDRSQLAGHEVGDGLEERPSEQAIRVCERELDDLDRVAPDHSESLTLRRGPLRPRWQWGRRCPRDRRTLAVSSR
jgi:hypothetical protein